VWSFFLPLTVTFFLYYPVSQEDRILRSQFETCPQNRLRIVQEKAPPDPTPGLGIQETPRTDGGKDTVYYSIVSPEEKKKKEEETPHWLQERSPG